MRCVLQARWESTRLATETKERDLGQYWPRFGRHACSSDARVGVSIRLLPSQTAACNDIPAIAAIKHCLPLTSTHAGDLRLPSPTIGAIIRFVRMVGARGRNGRQSTEHRSGSRPSARPHTLSTLPTIECNTNKSQYVYAPASKPTCWAFNVRRHVQERRCRCITEDRNAVESCCGQDKPCATEVRHASGSVLFGMAL